LEQGDDDEEDDGAGDLPSGTLGISHMAKTTATP
jgi:hypothetical protein